MKRLLKFLFVIILIVVGLFLLNPLYSLGIINVVYRSFTMYKNVTFVPIDMKKKLGLDSNYTYSNQVGTFLIPNTPGELNLLISMEKKLYGIKTKNEFIDVQSVMEKETFGASSPSIYLSKFVLGCNNTSSTCFILEYKYLDYKKYIPVRILSYNYRELTFSTQYEFDQKPSNPDTIYKISKYLTHAIVITSDLRLNSNSKNFFIIDFNSGRINKTVNMDITAPLESVTFSEEDVDFFAKDQLHDTESGDSEYRVIEKTDVGSGMFGSDSTISIFNKDSMIRTFNCHNCNVRYAGKNSKYIFLLINEDNKLKIGKMQLK